MEYLSSYKSPIGKIYLTSNGKALTALWFENSRFDHTPKDYVENEGLFVDTKKWLDIYFSGKIPDFTPEIDLSLLDFAKIVTDIMLSIPYGTTTTYGSIAKTIAQLKGVDKISAQAVGGAVANNPISLIVPCHRVIGANGSLVGYSGGIERKSWLLEMEKKVKSNSDNK